MDARNTKNPGASLPRENAIIIYDEYFRIDNPVKVLSHEMGHILILSLDPEQIKNFLLMTGWKQEVKGMVWTGAKIPLKEDSISSPSEDLANHIEDFLHEREKMQNQKPQIFQQLESILESDFKLRNKK